MKNAGQQDSPKKEVNPLAFQVPPNLDICKKHRKATKITTAILESQLETWENFCPCCGLPISEEKISLCASSIELQHLGVSFPLYFQFLKYNILWLLVLGLIVGAYDIATNVIGAFCQGDSADASTTTDGDFCTKNFITMLTLANKQGNALYLKIHQWLNFGGIIFISLLLQCYRKAADRLIDECEKSQETPADFTVEVQDLPKHATKEDITKFFNELITNQLEVVKVNMAYSISNLVKIQRKYEALKKKQEENKENNVNDEVLSSEIQSLKDQLAEFEKSSQDLHDRPFTGVAFVTFKTPGQAFRVLDRLKAGFFKRTLIRFVSCFCCCKCISTPLYEDKYILDVRRAAEPSDVYWENLDSTDSQKLVRRSLTGFMTIVVLGVSFGLSLLVTFYKNENPNVQWLSILASVIIVVINIILGMLIRFFCRFEKHSTLTRFNSSVAEKLTIATFINTALVVLLANSVKMSELFDDPTDDSKFTFWKGGLMSSVTTLMLINAFSTNLSNYFNPWHFLRWCNRRKIIKQGQSCKKNQAQANAMFEGPQIDIAQRYANAMKTMLVSFFFAPAVPIILVFSFFGQILTYYTDFWLVVRRHAKPPQLGKELAVAIAEDIEWAPLAFATGNIIFNRYAYKGSNYDISGDWLLWLDIVILAIAGAILLLPMNVILKKIFCCCFGKETDANEWNDQPYITERKYFIDDYDIKNPVTHREGLIDWLAYLRIHDPKKYEIVKAQYPDPENASQLSALKGYVAAKADIGSREADNLAFGNQQPANVGMKKLKSGMDRYLINNVIQNQQDIELQIQQQVPNQGVPGTYYNQPGMQTMQQQEQQQFQQQQQLQQQQQEQQQLQQQQQFQQQQQEQQFQQQQQPQYFQQPQQQNYPQFQDPQLTQTQQDPRISYPQQDPRISFPQQDPRFSYPQPDPRLSSPQQLIPQQQIELQMQMQMNTQPQVQLGMQGGFPQFQPGQQQPGPFQGMPNQFQPNGQGFANPNGLIQFGPNGGNPNQGFSNF